MFLVRDTGWACPHPPPNFTSTITSHTRRHRQSSDPTTSGQWVLPLLPNQETEAGGGQSGGSEPAGRWGGLPGQPLGLQSASGDGKEPDPRGSSGRPPYKAASWGDLAGAGRGARGGWFPEGSQRQRLTPQTRSGSCSPAPPSTTQAAAGRAATWGRRQGPALPEPEREAGVTRARRKEPGASSLANREPRVPEWGHIRPGGSWSTRKVCAWSLQGPMGSPGSLCLPAGGHANPSHSSYLVLLSTY